MNDWKTKRDEMAQGYYEKWICGDKPSFKDGFDEGFKYAIECEELVKMWEALVLLKMHFKDNPNLSLNDNLFHFSKIEKASEQFIKLKESVGKCIKCFG